MTSPPLEDDAFVACVDLIERGVTTVQAMFHTFGDPDDYLEALHATIRGVEKSGIRAVIILGTTDQAEFLPLGAEDPGLPDFCAVSRRLSEAEFVEVVAHARAKYPEVTFGVGPVGPQWCSDSLLGTIGEIASEGYRIHSHFLESAFFGECCSTDVGSWELSRATESSPPSRPEHESCPCSLVLG
jgi:cytosine/adenosine deaminase-related metal-dependent hydrolase